VPPGMRAERLEPCPAQKENCRRPVADAPIHRVMRLCVAQQVVENGSHQGLLIDQRQQFLRCFRFTLLYCFEQTRHMAHVVESIGL
jgi:hypothetical protein